MCSKYYKTNCESKEISKNTGFEQNCFNTTANAHTRTQATATKAAACVDERELPQQWQWQKRMATHIEQRTYTLLCLTLSAAGLSSFASIVIIDQSCR